MGKMVKYNRNWSLFFITPLIILFAQTNIKALNVDISFNNCNATITTLISNIQSNERPSVGLFYRLVRTYNGEVESYYWQDKISDTDPTSKTINLANLPIGTYKVICYETRKNRPIKSAVSPPFDNSLTCSSTSYLMPHYLSQTNPILIEPSWNVFSDGSALTTTANHHTANSSYLSTTPLLKPWLIISMSIFDWKSYHNAVKLEYESSQLTYIGAIADNNIEKVSFSDWKAIANIDYTSTPGELTIQRGNSIQSNRVTQIYLIFQENNLSQNSVNFLAKLYDQTDTSNIVAESNLSLPVKLQPHDPNHLVVNKPSLCPCQNQETLEYQVSFQNDGKAEAVGVDIQLTNVDDLLPTTVSVIKTGSTANSLNKFGTVTFDQSTWTFSIRPPYYLPGSTQVKKPPKAYYPYHETEDYFKFTVGVKPCRKYGTCIRPKAIITFYEEGNNSSLVPILPKVHTNLETTIFNQKECSLDLVKCPKCKHRPTIIQKVFKR